jgi:hypothetical protein
MHPGVPCFIIFSVSCLMILLVGDSVIAQFSKIILLLNGLTEILQMQNSML